ncbi:hypothetical protein [Niabella beijingensis]|uniref:hypothetical protein n=1 Tax=Niabella beijingensis TaxID=2872700 RepID=UPI001CBAD0D3|nr:hypothetical protein [Niabella beijingensis]MBZ4189662.1 hypothetical protein [Niabella beijingensis]
MISFYILIFLEWISFLTGLFFFKKRGGGFVVAFLAAVVITETVVYFARLYLPDTDLVHVTNMWYNCMLPVQCTFLLLFFYKKTGLAYWRVLIKGFIGIVLFIAVLQFFAGGVTQFNTFNYTLEAIFISACSLHYLFELMNSEKIEEVTRDPFMYISIGLLLFYLGTLPYNITKLYLFETYPRLFYPYYYLFFAFNYFLYGIIIFGILWAKKK